MSKAKEEFGKWLSKQKKAQSLCYMPELFNYIKELEEQNEKMKNLLCAILQNQSSSIAIENLIENTLKEFCNPWGC